MQSETKTSLVQTPIRVTLGFFLNTLDFGLYLKGLRKRHYSYYNLAERNLVFYI